MDTRWINVYGKSQSTISIREIVTIKTKNKLLKQANVMKCDPKLWSSSNRWLFSITCFHRLAKLSLGLLNLTLLIVALSASRTTAHEEITRTQQYQQTHIQHNHPHYTTPNYRAKRSIHYSKLIENDGQWIHTDDDTSFRPIIPKNISPDFIASKVFTKTGQYRIFQLPTSDLRQIVSMEQKIDKAPMVRNKGNTIEGNILGSENDAINITANQYKNVIPTHNFINNATKLNNRNTKGSLIIGDDKKILLEDKLAKNLEKNVTSKQITNLLQTSDKLISNPQNSSKILPTKQKSTVEQKNLKNVNKKNVQSPITPNSLTNDSLNLIANDVKELEALLFEYVESFFHQAQYEPSDELLNALQKNHTSDTNSPSIGDTYKKRPTRHASAMLHHHHHYHQQYLHNDHLRSLSPLEITRKADNSININIPHAVESGRLLFSAGLKKMLWPIFMGLQVLKSLLFALFLPTLIGSFGKLLGKGIVTGSAPLFIRPADAPQELDFHDNTINFDDDKFTVAEDGIKGDGYAYNSQAEAASQTHYTYNAADINRNEQQNKMPDSYLSALQTIGSASFKNSGSLSSSSSAGALSGAGVGLGAPLRTKPISPANTNTFQTFQKVPASSLLLSNYDPFYSPLLSRLDSVFAQLKLNSDNENCREKLICLMYANPAKYAPFSNLVSAQLSRELNELRKPTSDNPDILRFFKYMRAAKDGQDGVDCEKSFNQCKEFKDFENPAMVSTYHDINKLVQARKLV